MDLHDFLEDKEFVEIAQGALTKTLSLLFRHATAFTILTNVARVKFEPQLPDEIRSRFAPITMFILDGYTLSSAKLEDGILSFEAGFGDDNFASLVSVPLGALLQIAIGDRPLFLNMSVDNGDTTQSKPKEKPLNKEDISKRSMDALLSNPDNKNLFKK